MVPMPDQTRERLTGLRNGLLKLHKSLMDCERALYEREVERITSAGQYLGLVMNDPWFAWLRELSQFIVVIDETLDLEQQPGPPDADRLIAKARALLSPVEGAGGFAGKYYELLQRDPAAVLAHGDMMHVFGSLTA